jgi:adenylate kinase family enzyme
MRKVAVFGNAGAGKSTLARRLAELTGLPLYPLDIIQFRGCYRPDEKDGGKLTHEEYLKIHADLLSRDRWIIDGYGSIESMWERFDVADTLVYIDLPLLTHYRWVTARLVKGLFRNPEGWPENSPVWSSTLDSYRVVWRCHRGLTPKYRQLVADASTSKRVHHLKSPAEMKAFLRGVKPDEGAVDDPDRATLL